MTAQDNYRQLEGLLQAIGKVAAAFSGGMDSSFLLKAAGFTYVALDLQGFRSGALNKVL